MSFDVCLQGKRLNLNTNNTNSDYTGKGSRTVKNESSMHTVLNIANVTPSTDTGALKKKPDKDKGVSDANINSVCACASNFDWGNVIIVLSLLSLFYTQFFSEMSMPLSNTHLTNFVLFFIVVFLPNECHVRASTHAALCLGTALTGSVLDTYHVTLPVVCVLLVQSFNVLYVHRFQTHSIEYVFFVLAVFTSTLCFVAAYTILPVVYAAWLESSALAILIGIILYTTRRAS
jgi:hypothetical protein